MAVEMRKRHQRPVGAFAFGQNREAVLIAQRLALAPGGPVYAVIKSVSFERS